MFFYNPLAFSMIQQMSAVWSLVPLPFLNPACISENSQFTQLLKFSLENFEHYFASMWDACNYVVVWAFFGIAFPWGWNKNWLFPVPKKGSAKECSNYHMIVLISHVSTEVMLRILQARLQQYMNQELPAVQAGFRKCRGKQRSNFQHSLDHRGSKRIPEKHLLLL